MAKGAPPVRVTGDPKAQPGDPRTPSLRSADVRDAALTLFALRGYHATSMKDIAAALGLQAPSLYNHVAAKQDILRDVMAGTMNALLVFVRASIESTTDVTQQVRRATEAHVRFHASHRREVRVGNYEIPALDEPQRHVIVELRRQYSRLFLDMIERGVAEGVFHCHSPMLASYSILQMGIGVAMWFREDGALSEESVAYQYGDIALRIVGADVAVKKGERKRTSKDKSPAKKKRPGSHAVRMQRASGDRD